MANQGEAGEETIEMVAHAGFNLSQVAKFLIIG